MKTLISGLLLLGLQYSSSAVASELNFQPEFQTEFKTDFKSLKCDAPDGFHRQIKEFDFFTNPAGEPAVFYKEVGYSRYAEYKVEGNKLTIGYPVDIVFDISNPLEIRRQIHECVRSPYGEVSCMDLIETCVLN
jgi:hypothetical protein